MKSWIIKSILLGKIVLKKRAMYRKAKLFGIKDSRVVTCSQNLDELLNKYQGI